MTTVRRKVHSSLGTEGRKKLVQALVAQLVALGWPDWMARNIAWWRFRNGQSLVVRKVVS